MLRSFCVRALSGACLLAAMACVPGGASADSPEAKAKRNGATFEGWGKMTDPLEDTEVKVEEGKLTMTVPGGLHDINPTLGGMKAPRILREVTGNFTLEVTVTGDFTPGQKSAKDGVVAFNGAGISLWVNDKTYVRLERNAWWDARSGGYVCYTPLYEIFNGGRQMPTNPGTGTPDFFAGQSTRFRLERKGTALISSYSQDGGKTWEARPRIASTFPAKLQIGIGAVSTSKEPFTVTFEDYKLTTAK